MPATVRLSAFYFAYFCHLGAYVAYFPLWLEARGYSPGEIALVLTLPALLRIVAPAAWGWVADHGVTQRLGGRSTLVAALSIAAAGGFALLAGTERLASVLACVAFAALFSSAVLPLVDVMTLSALGARIGGYGPVRLWGSIGFIASVLAVGVLLDYVEVGWLVPVVAGALLAAAGCAGTLPHSAPPESAPGEPGVARRLREPRVAALFAAGFCMTAAHGALYAFYSIYLVEAGYSKALVGGLWTAGVVAEIVLFIALPALFRRYSLRALLLVSFAAAVLRFAVIGWGATSLAMLALAQLLHAFTFGAYHSASVAAIHRLFPGAVAVRGQALYASVSYGFGGVAGLLLAGWSWSTLGPALTFTLSAVSGLVGALLVAWKVRL